MAFWNRTKEAAEIESASVGIAVGPHDVTLVACDGEVEGRPNITAWEVFPYESMIDLETGLRRFVDAHGLAERSCRCTLQPEDYSLRLVERPANVPDEELADATRWLIRDLVEFDVESAELAILILPEDQSRARTPRMFVVAARNEAVVELATAINGSGLELVGFEILESTMLALDSRMPEIVAGGAVLRLDGKTSVLTLSHDEHLYLARNLHVDLYAIDQAADRALSEEDPAGPSIIEALDGLLLDVQRSFDYYESEYGQAPASRLTLLPGPVDLTPLVPALSEALRPVQIECYELGQLFEFPEAPPSDLQQSLAVAAGAAVAPSELIGHALLPATFRKSDGGFGISSVARIIGAIAALLVVSFGVARYQLDRQQASLGILEAERDRISNEIEAARALAAARKSTSDPEAEIAMMTAQRDARISMLRDMTQRGSSKDASFSNLLGGLARQDLASVWLERIEFSNGGDEITLEGRTLDPGDIPSYLRRLGTETGFTSRTFRTFEIERSNGADPGLAFRLATLDDPTDSDGGQR